MGSDTDLEKEEDGLRESLDKKIRKAMKAGSVLSVLEDVPVHQFSVNGSTFEWIDGQYFKKINEIKDGGCFGQDALINELPRNATIKTMDDTVHLTTLSKAEFKNSLEKIEQKRINKIIEFLQNIPCFRSQNRRAI